MSYRRDDEAREHRKQALEKELAEVEQELAPLKSRAAALKKGLKDVEAQERVTLPVLDRVQIKNPCPKKWDDMVGGDRVRFCGVCEKNVFNLSAMERPEAEELLREKNGDLCVRLFRRPDGTVMTSDCKPGRRKKRRRNVALAVVAAGASAAAAFVGTRPSGQCQGGDEDVREVAGGLSIPVDAWEEPDPPPRPLMGKPAPPPPEVEVLGEMEELLGDVAAPEE